MIKSETNNLIDLALAGNKKALEKLLTDIQNLVFNLSLRMLGMISDAEDASQEILIRIMTNLSAFRKESSFTTWVYRIAVNYLLNYRKALFVNHPLSFEYYAEDINKGYIDNSAAALMDVDEELLTEELKMSCTNVMLQCFDAESRCIFILGTMFKINSQTASDILGISADNYRQKLCRSRKKMAKFLACYCGLTESGSCSCKNRTGYAVKNNRLNPNNLEFSTLDKLDDNTLLACKSEMEKLDKLSIIFENMPKYKSPKSAESFLKGLLNSPGMSDIQNYV